MRILNQPEKPENAEVHVILSRQELERLLYDIENETSFSSFYTSSQEFVSYLRAL
jgi:hypothetical protein